jgi:putative hemolysin
MHAQPTLAINQSSVLPTPAKFYLQDTWTTKNIKDIQAAQRLRYKVFGEELGSTINQDHPGCESDRFDLHCDHLLVRTVATGEVIGTCRLISPVTARTVGSFYAESEFSLERLHHLRDDLLEIDRFCIHPDYRSGRIMAMLWAGLGQYIARHKYLYLIGCASISVKDGGHHAADIFQQFRHTHLMPSAYRATPYHPLPYEKLASGKPADPTLMPPLIKAYLRAGGRICGEPAWDTDFNVADLLFMLPMTQLNHRYGRTFLDPYRPIEGIH